MGCNCGNKGNKTNIPLINQTCNAVPKQPTCTKCHKTPCACVEDHTLRIMETSYTTTVSVTHDWVMPAENDCVQLHLKDVINILPGAILYNQSVGHLHVSSYDSATGYVLACNRGDIDNAEAGTTFPSCMSFHVGIPLNYDSNIEYTGPCLAADFTSPKEGECGIASVSNVSGLYIADVIDLSGYMYRISNILDVNTITICNEGFGAPAGTVIKHDPSCTGKGCAVRITVVNNDNPCAKEPTDSGMVLVCKEGVQKPIAGNAEGQVLGWDNGRQEWRLVNAGVTDKCTYITKCGVTLDPQVTSYIIYVNDPSIFSVGTVFVIDNITYTVQEVHTGSSESQRYIRASRAAPSTISIIPQGTSICLNEDGCDLENWCQQITTNKNNITTIMGPTWRPRALQRVSIPFQEIPVIQSYTGSEGELLANTASPSSVTKDFSHTFSLPVPTPNTGSSSWTLCGTAVISYRGNVYCDGHYHHDRSLPVTYLISVIPAITVLAGNISVNGNKIIVDSNNQAVDITERLGWNYSARIDNVSSHKMTSANINALVDANNQCYGPASQSITIPFSITVPYSTSNFDLTVDAKVTIENSIKKEKATSYYDMSSPGINDDIKLQLNRSAIFLSGLWVIS